MGADEARASRNAFPLFKEDWKANSTKATPEQSRASSVWLRHSCSSSPGFTQPSSGVGGSAPPFIDIITDCGAHPYYLTSLSLVGSPEVPNLWAHNVFRFYIPIASIKDWEAMNTWWIPVSGTIAWVAKRGARGIGTLHTGPASPRCSRGLEFSQLKS
ncbi:hypothetical protein BS47DRAFT_1391214 [Hydnum rufescens UP504]|uniref:Uncharacterized protein n=1 Tax=Hydnum rufescens UP504 TaxID=1448309 RepID=A0A9P6B3Z4_9AGAM|nr:hypothetical protein BS47DRAFT_1391214 [Hydnum rufescens UP504]